MTTTLTTTEKLRAIAEIRCPNCRDGKVFIRSVVHDCSHCNGTGFRFWMLREPCPRDMGFPVAHWCPDCAGYRFLVKSDLESVLMAFAYVYNRETVLHEAWRGVRHAVFAEESLIEPVVDTLYDATAEMRE